MDQSYDEAVILAFREWVRDKRSATDLEFDYIWCPLCQKGHAEPCHGCTIDEFYVEMMKGEEDGQSD